MFFLLYLIDEKRIRDPDPYLWLMDPDPGSPKTYGSYGSGSAKLPQTQKKWQPLAVLRIRKYFFRNRRPCYPYFWFTDLDPDPGWQLITDPDLDSTRTCSWPLKDPDLDPQFGIMDPDPGCRSITNPPDPDAAAQQSFKSGSRLDLELVKDPQKRHIMLWRLNVLQRVGNPSRRSKKNLQFWWHFYQL